MKKPKPRPKMHAAKAEARQSLIAKMDRAKATRKAEKEHRIREGRAESQIGEKREDKTRQWKI